MKRVIRQSLKEMFFRYLSEFCNEKEKDTAQIEHYAENFTNEFDRYLSAYYDFKED